MKTNLKSNSILLGGLLLLGTVFSCTQAEQDYASYVNPFIGTGGHGHTYPGAVVPNGMIQPSPDTRIYEWDACSGYYYEDTTINGFSHTHVSGTGCADYGDVLLMPTVGHLYLSVANRSIIRWDRRVSKWRTVRLSRTIMKWRNPDIIPSCWNAIT